MKKAIFVLVFALAVAPALSVSAGIMLDNRQNVDIVNGDNVTISAELIVPIALEQGLNFAIREGGRTVGAGVVTEVIQ